MPPTADLAALTAFNARARTRGWPFICYPAGNFQHAELTAAFTTWCEKAGRRAMPARSDLTPRNAKAFMSHMSLLERLSTGNGSRYRVRLHGSSLARYGGDGTGRFLDEVVHDGRVHGYAAVYDLVLELLAPLRVESRYQAPDISYLTGESFLAPLSRPEGPPLILSVTYARARTEPRDA